MSLGNEPNVCGVCGNSLQDGRCWRCSANEATRDKKWRSGDRGGVRPERRGLDEPDLTLFDALNGIWHSKANQLEISIDMSNSRWTFRDAEGRQRIQHWKPRNQSGNHLTFYNNDGKIIKAHLRSDGILVMCGKKKPLDFVYLDSEHEYRTCIKCYRRTEIENTHCKHCGVEFHESPTVSFPV